MRARLARLGRLAASLLALLVIALLVQLAWVVVVCQPFAAVEPVADAAPSLLAAAGFPDAVRPPDQSYLTLPEWYIVYSSEEYATFIQEHPPSRFPYFAAIGQYWQSYREVCGVTRGRYPFNTLYHFTLFVIGPSFTVENAVRGLYEKSIGWGAEWTSGGEPTAEEVLARRVALDYGNFLHTIPWFEYPFGDRLRELWATTGLWGPHPIRKWERKWALTLEYGVKALYGRLIRGGAGVTYAPEKLEILAVVEGVSAEMDERHADLRIVQPLDNGQTIVALPRYEPFTQLAPVLVEEGVQFVEIAGNSTIMLTALAPHDWVYDLSAGELLFAMPILTEPEVKRVAINAPVSSLHRILAELAQRGIKLEHLYDY
ncbi:MAG: hypothetical protein DCC55_30010 [Chloroflexi bacterium]|nr:MAG: hypothetical protein DCC55_30010 [Chloroflexota bacterium]